MLSSEELVLDELDVDVDDEHEDEDDDDEEEEEEQDDDEDDDEDDDDDEHDEEEEDDEDDNTQQVMLGPIFGDFDGNFSLFSEHLATTFGVACFWTLVTEQTTPPHSFASTGLHVVLATVCFFSPEHGAGVSHLSHVSVHMRGPHGSL